MKRLMVAVTMLFFLCGVVSAATISITPDTPNAYAVIEAAQSGDLVEMAPGTYSFRLYLTVPNVTIIAQDTNNKPVFDYTGQACELWPGTISATDWKSHYGIIVQANGVVLENIIIKGARSNMTSSGIYVGVLGVVKEPAPPGSMPENVILRGLEIADCDDGINAAAINLLVENCEVHGNGDPTPGALSGDHNFYIQGGSIQVKNCNIYHALSGQNFNTRAQDTLIEDCILGDMASYPMLVSTPKATAVNGVDHIQTVTIRRTQISGIRHNGLGLSKFFEVANASNYAGLSQYLVLEDCVLNGADGGAASIVYLHRYSGTKALGIKATGNTYKNFGKYLRLNSGEVNTDPTYVIDVQDWADDSLPAGSVTPPPPVDPPVSFTATWTQSTFPDGFKGWNIYSTLDVNNWGTPKFIAYTAGTTSYSTKLTLPVASDYFFRIKGVNIKNQETDGSLEAAITQGVVELPTLPDTFNVTQD